MTTQTEKTVADLTIAEFRELIRETVAEAVAELINDPDEGLELSDWAAARLGAADGKLFRAFAFDPNRKGILLWRQINPE